MYGLTNMHGPPVEGNFTDESGQAIRPRVVEDYNTHMGFVDKSDRMVNSYGIARRTWKWTKKLFFHLTDKLETSSIHVEFYSLSNSFYFVILCYIEQKIYLFLWRDAISRFKCPKNSGRQGTTGI